MELRILTGGLPPPDNDEPPRHFPGAGAKRPPPPAIDLECVAEHGAMNDLATFRMELKVVSQKLDIAWRDLNAKVSMDRVPSTIVAHALDRHGPELPEYKGSELNDEYLLRLGLYADRTYVDKRTLEGLRRAKAKVPILKDLLPDVRRAANYSEMTFES